MSREEIHKLVGGYATGTLTPAEQEALFQAALEDQELFDALAHEQALRDLLSDPAAKGQLLAALDERPPRWYQQIGWLRPAAAALAMASVTVLAVVAWRQRVVSPVMAPKPPLVAEVRPAQPPAPVPPAQDRPAGAASAVPASGAAGHSRAPLARAKAALPPSQPTGEVAAPTPTAAQPTPALSGPERKSEAIAGVPPAAPAGVAGGALRASPRLPAFAPSPSAAPRFAAPAAADAALRVLPAPTLGGTVTDPAGAVVRDATVIVASNNPTVQKQAKTDALGNWSVEIPRPGPYQVTVAAAGFKTERAAVELQSADSKQINLRLDVGSAAETVEVTAATPLIAPFQQQGQMGAQLQTGVPQALATLGAARGGFGGGGRGGAARPLGARQLYEEAAAQPQAKVTRVATANATQPVFRSVTGSVTGPVLGLRYTFLAAVAGVSGNSLAIQFTPTEDGYLRVTTPAGAVLVATRLEHTKPFTTPPLPPGEKQLVVTYSRPLPAAKQAEKAQAPLVQPLQETIEGVTYVAMVGAQAQMSFTIDVK